MTTRSPGFLKLKMLIKKELVKALYGTPTAHYLKGLEDIIVRQALVRSDGVRAFVHRGVKYWMPGERVTCRVFPRLEKVLVPYMDELLSIWNPVLQDERYQVEQFIAHVLNTSDDPFVYLKMLPSGLRDYIRPLYEQTGIDLHGVTFAESEPEADVWKPAYKLLCGRVTANVILGMP